MWRKLRTFFGDFEGFTLYGSGEDQGSEFCCKLDIWSPMCREILSIKGTLHGLNYFWKFLYEVAHILSIDYMVLNTMRKSLKPANFSLPKESDGPNLALMTFFSTFLFPNIRPSPRLLLYYSVWPDSSLFLSFCRSLRSDPSWLKVKILWKLCFKIASVFRKSCWIYSL